MKQIKPIEPNTYEHLSKKVVQGGMWVFSLRIINRGLGFVRTIVLAHLLAPSDFGLLGIAMLAIGTLETFSQTGFQTALIQKKDNIASYLDTTWTVSFIRGILLFLILFFSAPLVASFFNSPQAASVIKVVAVSTLLLGFQNIGILFFQRDLELNKYFYYQLSSSLIDLTISVILAFALQNVWALVWGGLAGNSVRLLMSYVLHPYRPRVSFSKDTFKELSGVGIWVMGSGVLDFMITRGDDIFVGKMLGVTALGFYQMAYLISNLPATEITYMISQVTFPAYSKMQDDMPRLREAFLDVVKLNAFISIPMAGGIFILAPEFTLIFLGEKWMPMVPAMQLLALAGLTVSIVAMAGTLFVSVGKPRIDTLWQVIRLAVLIICIYPLTANWNLSGTAIAVLLSVFISTVGISIQVVRILECRVRSYIKVIALPAINGLIMVMILLLAKGWFHHSGLMQFFLLVILGIMSYGVITILFDRFLNYGMIRLIIEKIES
ncbi:MAG: lipopolysaccharide biosynthesis protein [Deltaproteobacteria bacterium]|nr:lipopolysaccharide biosynthesis protein [Deltaproteobacteria bacterium]